MAAVVAEALAGRGRALARFDILEPQSDDSLRCRSATSPSSSAQAVSGLPLSLHGEQWAAEQGCLALEWLLLEKKANEIVPSFSGEPSRRQVLCTHGA